MSEHLGQAAIVVAGGSGERFGRPGGKQLARLAGLPVVSWALAALDAAELDLVVLVCPAERRAEFEREAVAPLQLVTSIAWADSGSTRQESVRNGMAVLPPSVSTVVVHDGARPLVTAELVKRTVQELGKSQADGAVIGHPSYDTLKRVEGGRVVSTPDRQKYWAVQTPQVFLRQQLQAAHEAAVEQGFEGTDDAALVEWAGGTVVVVEGPQDNVKVTVPEDLAYAEAVLAHRREERS